MADQDRSAYDSSNTNKLIRAKAAEWIVASLKVVGPAFGALVLMYVAVQEHGGRLDRLDRESEARASRVMAIETNLIELRAIQQSDNREIVNGMRRMEEVIREVRTDVKELQRRP